MKSLLLCFLAIAAIARAASTPKTPNIVFIFSDDHAYQAISAYGDARKLLDTPNIDRIAKQGLRFDRCLVTNSICGPARATILTGKYSHLNGFPNNSNSTFDGAQQTFPKLLQRPATRRPSLANGTSAPIRPALISGRFSRARAFTIIRR